MERQEPLQYRTVVDGVHLEAEALRMMPLPPHALAKELGVTAADIARFHEDPDLIPAAFRLYLGIALRVYAPKTTDVQRANRIGAALVDGILVRMLHEAARVGRDAQRDDPTTADAEIARFL